MAAAAGSYCKHRLRCFAPCTAPLQNCPATGRIKAPHTFALAEVVSATTRHNNKLWRKKVMVCAQVVCTVE
jgi:hypothetical protein